jgi:N-acetyl-anhydromuramyl-L-alanine amidase AmpD
MALYNGATFRKSPNLTAGRNGQAVKAVVLHITEGPRGREYDSAVNWFLNPSSQVSAHFVTSPAGDVTQCVDTANTAWANGLAYRGGLWSNTRGKVVAPTWQLITAPISPNHQTVSIETAGQHGEALPAAQWGALYALLRWLGTVYPALLPYAPGRTLIRHADLDTVDRANCPGSAFDLDKIAAAVNTPPPTPAPVVYEYPGLAVYERADLTGPIAGYLPSDSTLAIDATSGPGYAPSAGHLVSGMGFVDMRQVRRKLERS